MREGPLFKGGAQRASSARGNERGASGGKGIEKGSNQQAGSKGKAGARWPGRAAQTI